MYVGRGNQGRFQGKAKGHIGREAEATHQPPTRSGGKGNWESEPKSELRRATRNGARITNSRQTEKWSRRNVNLKGAIPEALSIPTTQLRKGSEGLNITTKRQDESPAN